jgi:hypothetical protein
VGKIVIPNEGGSRGAAYSQVVAQENSSGGFRRSSFEPPPDLRSHFFFEGAAKGKEMEIDTGLVQAKVVRPWEPRKCIPRAPLAPKYVIITPRIEEKNNT